MNMKIFDQDAKRLRLQFEDISFARLIKRVEAALGQRAINYRKCQGHKFFFSS
jgi:hypothetical protein